MCALSLLFWWLSKHNARALLTLIRKTGLSYTPSINPIILTLMRDVQQWMENVAAYDLSCHVHQHQLKKDLCADDKAQLLYKKWSTCPSLSPEGEQIKLLKDLPTLVLENVKQDVSNLHLEKLKMDLPKDALHFNRQTQKWWEGNIQNRGQLLNITYRGWILLMLKSSTDLQTPKKPS